MREKKKIEPRKIVSGRRAMTAAERTRWLKNRELVEADKADILTQGKRYTQAALAERAAINEALKLLRSERERQGLSLSDMRDRTSIEPSTLSKLENAEDPNPTIGTLSRIAEALGKSIVIQLVDQ